MDTLDNRHGPRHNDLSTAKPTGNLQSCLAAYNTDYALGIVLLMIVVLLWTSSNFLTQDLYEGGYDKPFLVTYMNTSAFSLYLLPFLIRRWWFKDTKSQVVERSSVPYQPLSADDNNPIPTPSSSIAPEHHHLSPDAELPPLTVSETAHLAFAFCLLWFIANWSVNASLGYTSVASATILSSTSGFFTLTIGRIFRVEKLTVIKIMAVLISFFGVLMVSLSDAETKKLSGPASHPTLQKTNVDSRATFGDILALISALFYALYVILLKVRIKSESRVDMQLFFGFVGLFNISFCWPIGVILHFTKAEIFEWPSNPKAIYAILINASFWELHFLKSILIFAADTTPLVVTIGLSLTIPVAVVGDFIRQRPSHIEVIIGALLVIVGFVAIGLEKPDDVSIEVEQRREQSSS
ncbi:hypothetical protein CVT24_000881 [Panaeolus cyanescens]|uniref:EamA domain-containing protein n=1 Tax=Panaeolus cyanescens TaxID=181874 RepID=A0A409YCC3_9AGAR|nr:hypothetical protein CVT24_000881 [Panaeolus cyanescens]